MAERAPTVAIIGGGLAGLSAACALAGSGFHVTVFERRPYLGGRASSYEHPGTGEVVDNCQHVLFGSCTNLLAFYRTIGIENKIRWFDRMTFVEPGGRQSVLESTFLPAPLHLTPSFLGFKFLNATDKVSLARGLMSLMFRKPQEKDDGTSFHDWLIRHRQTPAAIERFWKPILVSALSEDMDRISVPYAAQVVRESMKSPEARRMGIPNVPLTELYNAARDYISSHNGSLRLRDRVQAFVPTSGGVRLKLQTSEEEFDYGVLAVPFDSLAKLLPEAPESSDLREKLTHFETSPITGVHLWFDRQISDLPHAVLLDRTIQWMFHKSHLLNRESSNSFPSQDVVPTPAPQGRNNAAQGASPGYVNAPTQSRRDERNATVNEREGRTSTLLPNAPSPVRTTASNPSYIELVISSSKSLREKSRQEIIDLALAELREFFPAARDAVLLKSTVIKEVNATFSPTPGIDRYRPTSKTPWRHIFLAGDWTATGWPATMEGAVRSGYKATESITTDAGAGKRFLVPDLPATGLMRILG
jgi:squalene-associated FAD-dependent desaturase